MRIKSRWYKADKPRSEDETASALGFIAWGIAVDRVKNLEAAGYYINLPERTLNVIEEFLAFVIQAVDRHVYSLWDDDRRRRLVTALALKVADTVADNRVDAQGSGEYRREFIALLNQRLEDYAALSGPDEALGYSSFRFLGDKVVDALGPDHGRGAAAQVIEADAPQALENLHRAMRNLIDNEH